VIFLSVRRGHGRFRLATHSAGDLESLTMRAIFGAVCLFLLLGPIGCKSSVNCTDFGAGYGERSTIKWDSCADKKSREVVCELLSPGKYTCQCLENGTKQKSFDRLESTMGDKKQATQIANDACGWNLTVP
jgi:hypothetical protein